LGGRRPQLWHRLQVFSPPPPGVDVMITIFGDFCLFSAGKMAFFFKNKQKSVKRTKNSNFSPNYNLRKF
jgi:hypothetical protein